MSEEWTAYGREAWERAGVADRIDLRIAPALGTLRSMPAEPHIDFAYLDADKGNYIPTGKSWCRAFGQVG